MKTVLAAILCATTTLGLIQVAAAQDKLRIATEGAYPPFNQLDPDGSLSGFDVDIAKALCADMKVSCEFVKQDWDGLIPGLLARKFDVIAASMTINEERKKRVDFTEKYYQTPAQFSAKKGSGFDVTPEGLKGKTIGVQRGTIQACYLEKFYTGSELKVYPSSLEVFNDLVAGRVDIAFSDRVSAQEQLLKAADGSSFELVGPPQKDPSCLGEGVGLALRKNDEELRSKLNTAIQNIRSNGTYATINAKYFPFDLYGEQ